MKEPFLTTFRGVGSFMANTLQGTAGKGRARADYGKFCREHRDQVVNFLRDYVGQRTNGVRTVRALEVPRKHDGADLFLEVSTEGVPNDTVYYVVRCPVGVVGSVEVTLVDG